MPKLLAYLPCEKVVVEEQSKNVSVLSILETVTVSLAPAATRTFGRWRACSSCWGMQGAECAS
jgi:hypothetical protein